MDGITLRSGSRLALPLPPVRREPPRTLPLVVELVLRNLLNRDGAGKHAPAVEVDPDARLLMMRMIAKNPRVAPTLKKLYQEVVIRRANEAPFPAITCDYRLQTLRDQLLTHHGRGVRFGQQITSLNLLKYEHLSHDEIAEVIRLCPAVQRLQAPIAYDYSGFDLLNSLSDAAKKQVTHWTFVPDDLVLLPQGDQFASEYPNLTQLRIQPPANTREHYLDQSPVYLPEAIKERVTMLHSEWVNIAELDLPNAQSVKVKYNCVVTRLDLPLAEKIEVYALSKLTAADIPRARKLSMTLCPLIQRLDIPLVQDLLLSVCSSLHTLNIPESLHGLIWDCPELATAPRPPESDAESCRVRRS